MTYKFEVGDIVVGVPESECHCPHSHDDTGGWTTSNEHDHLILRIAGIRPDPDGTGCILLRFKDDPIGLTWEWCAGFYRPIHRAEGTAVPLTQELEPA